VLRIVRAIGQKSHRLLVTFERFLRRAEDDTRISGGSCRFAVFPCSLETTCAPPQYGSDAIKAALGKATLLSAGGGGWAY
jgi:hypothetical protein